MFKRPFFLFMTFSGFLLLTSSAHLNAHEYMSSRGFFSCLACHTSSTGGGMLTDYGKGIAAAMAIRPSEYSEGRLKSAIRGDGRFDHAVQGRLAHARRNGDARTFPMQADFLSAMRVTPNTQVQVTASRAPKNARVKGENKTVEEVGGMSKYFLRKLVVGHQVNEKVKVEVGRDEIPSGLHLEDHTLYIREQNKFGPTEFSSQLRATFESPSQRHFATAFFPSGQESSNNRESGAALKHEFLLAQKGVLGTSLLWGQTNAITRQLASIHLKWPLGPFFFLGQLGLKKRELREQNVSFTQSTSLSRIYLTSFESLSPHISFETLSRRSPFEQSQQRYGIGANWRLRESTSLVIDYKKTRADRIDEDLLITQIFLNLF